jgi:hypothetical protein
LLATAAAVVEPLVLAGSNVILGIPLSHVVVVIFDAAAMVGVVLPPVRRDLRPVDVDPIVFVDVDIDVAAAPVEVAPAPN